jgi:hypothetical protein
MPASAARHNGDVGILATEEPCPRCRAGLLVRRRRYHYRPINRPMFSWSVDSDCKKLLCDQVIMCMHNLDRRRLERVAWMVSP